MSIEEWIREIVVRPESAPVMLRTIAARLVELESACEALRAENLALRSASKVEEYESRIANLQYQLELLKRQLRSPLSPGSEGEAARGADCGAAAGYDGAGYSGAANATASLLVFTSYGQVLRFELDIGSSVGGETVVARLPLELEQASAAAIPPEYQLTAEDIAGLVFTSSQQELLFVFSTGRTATAAVADIPACGGQEPGWENAYVQEPHAGETLVAVLPAARMSLFDYCVQVSRKGYAKKIKESFLENFIASNYIGSGVRLAADETGCLAFCNEADLFVLVTRLGYLASLPVQQLPVVSEEVMRLGTERQGDHIVSVFVVGGEQQTGETSDILLVTQSGKVIHRQSDWLEPANSFKSQGQAVFSKARREAGVRIVGASSVREDGWGAVLTTDGSLSVQRLAEVLASGSFACKDIAPAESSLDGSRRSQDLGAGKEIMAFAVYVP